MNDCTPMLARLMPAMRQSEKLPAWEGEGLISMVVSAPGKRSKASSQAAIMSSNCSAVRVDGVPPPKNTESIASLPEEPAPEERAWYARVWPERSESRAPQ